MPELKVSSLVSFSSVDEGRAVTEGSLEMKRNMNSPSGYNQAYFPEYVGQAH